MRTWLVIAIAVAGCKGEKKPAGGSAATVTPKDASISVLDDPPLADGAPTAELDEYAWLDSESLGPLKLDMADADVIKALGKPQQRSAVVEEGATGEFVAEWAFTGVTLKMGGDTAQGPFKVRSIAIAKPSTFTTAKGIKIGSTQTELEAAYARSAEPTEEPDQYLVGSVYGGMLFGLGRGKVDSIFIGTMAE